MHPRPRGVPVARASTDDVRFKRSRFVARFPKDYRYSPAHFWLCEEARHAGDEVSNGEGSPQRWRIGLTNFATRMLGEIVEFDFEAQAGTEVTPGTVVGWVEGFKATADLFCIGKGTFVGGNPTALADPELVCKDPYGDGWLYCIEGEPDTDVLTIDGYLEMLGETIDKMEERPWQGAEMP